jgi:hypothetical protein
MQMHRNRIGSKSATETRRQTSTKRAHDDPVHAIASTSQQTRGDGAGQRTLPVKITRDYWASDDATSAWPSQAVNRIAAGSIVELPLGEAKRAIEAGAAERTDPLPGE